MPIGRDTFDAATAADPDPSFNALFSDSGVMSSLRWSDKTAGNRMAVQVMNAQYR